MTIKPLFYLLLLCLTSAQCCATVFYSKNEALELAFGKGAKTELLTLFPEPDESSKIQTLAKQNLESGMFSFYVGTDANNKTLGYAAIETNTVRTKPETLMIVLDATGQVTKVLTLAFHEPPEYQPAEHWYDQFNNRKIEDMDFNKGIQGVSGATLSTRSAINSVRKVVAYYLVMLKDKSAK